MNVENEAPRTRNIAGRPRREAQIDALLAGIMEGGTVTQAAEVAGLARSTAYELLQQPGVRDRLAALRAESLREAATVAAAVACEAIATLADLMRSSKHEGIRKAADSLLMHAEALAGSA